MLMNGFEVTPKIKKELVARIALLRARLSSGASDDRRKAKAFVGLFNAFPSRSKDADTTAEAYMDAVAPDPAWAVEEVCQRIVRGEAQDIDLRFCPNAPQIVHYVKMVMSRWRRELEDLIRLEQCS